jgi:hypothetical protein
MRNLMENRRSSTKKKAVVAQPEQGSNTHEFHTNEIFFQTIGVRWLWLLKK